MSPPLVRRFRWRTAVVSAVLFAAAYLGAALHPTLVEGAKAPSLATVVPKQIGDWHELPSPLLQVNTFVAGESTSRDQPYDDILSRTYVNSQGQQIMVALAYGAQQRQEVKIHRPELCYPAQGWRVLNIEPVTFPVKTPSGQPIVGHRLLTKKGEAVTEAVSYWIRIGNSYSDSPWLTRWAILREGLQGRMTDGILVRVSQRLAPGEDEKSAFERQEKFAAQLAAATSPAGKPLLIR